jgi:hypothetical protein
MIEIEPFGMLDFCPMLKSTELFHSMRDSPNLFLTAPKMASFPVTCVCELSMTRLPATVVRCPCGLFHLPSLNEFVHPRPTTNQMAFMPPRLLQPLIFPELPCQPLLMIDPASGENIVVEYENNFGPNCHPFWIIVKTAFDANATDWSFQLQQIAAEASSGPTPLQYHRRLQRLRSDCSCVNCSCINFST